MTAATFTRNAHALRNRDDRRRPPPIGLAAPKLLTSGRAAARATGSSDSIRSCEPRVEAAVRIALSPQLRQRDRALGEAFEDEIVERAVLGEIATGASRRSPAKPAPPPSRSE